MALTRRDLIRTGVTLGIAATAVPMGTATADDFTIWDTDSWGARPPAEPVALLDHPPTFIVVHHTATPNTTDLSRPHAFKLSRAIQNYHMDRRGWIDSGQQFTNSRGGHVTEGRHGSLDAVRTGHTHVQGANVANRNREVVGIENEGMYVTDEMPEQQWAALVELVTFIAREYGVKPGQIRGHRDFSSTQCPGDTLYRRLPELRSTVGERLAQPVVEPETWPLLRPGDTGARVLAAQHLLRDRGEDLPTDGVFGPATFTAMARYATRAGLAAETCYGTATDDESGFIGAAAWPALVRRVDPADGSDAARAARALGSGPAVVDSRDWRILLDG
ncbi:MAG TPA: N-acetylmuramoyl-L-alanine amidase [Actinokineospora sp.]|nr:N-acetylmuramoyl-L-alanine amidase [Actinokineospora sp.]